MTNSSVQPTQPQVYASSTLAEVDDLLSRAQELQLSDAAGAFVLCEKALEEARRLDISLGVGRSLYTRSRLFLQLSNPQSALADASAALLHFEALDDRWRTESTLNLLGLTHVLHLSIDELERSLLSLRKPFTVAHKLYETNIYKYFENAPGSL